LQQIRDDQKIRLEIKTEDTKYKIVPISLQILVENALKHNSATIEKPLVISIVQHSDVVEVRNNLQKRTTFQKSTGTGLANLKERVRYISKKEIEVEETNQEFIVNIPIIPDYEGSDR
jgi:LytS/YehU family sensor histidine kinase